MSQVEEEKAQEEEEKDYVDEDENDDDLENVVIVADGLIKKRLDNFELLDSEKEVGWEIYKGDHVKKHPLLFQAPPGLPGYVD